MKYCFYVTMLGLMFATSARAIVIEGSVSYNKHDADGYSFGITTSYGKNADIFYGEDEPGEICPLGNFFNVASKLTPDQRVRVAAPDRYRQPPKNGIVTYYLCDEGSSLELVQ